MTAALTGAAIARFSQGTVGTDASLGVHAPEKSVIARLHGFVMSGRDELTLPSQAGAKIRMIDIEACFAAMNHE
jgi:hypothetical protein